MSELRGRDKGIVGLLALFMATAVTIELWLLVFGGEGLVARAQSGDPIAIALSIYGQADRSFYDRPTPFVLGLESINVFFTQVLNAWLIFAILRNKAYRHALQLAVGSYVAYSVVLYFWVHHLSGYREMNSHDTPTFLLFVVPNLPWLLGSLYLAYDSACMITRRFSVPAGGELEGARAASGEAAGREQYPSTG